MGSFIEVFISLLYGVFQLSGGGASTLMKTDPFMLTKTDPGGAQHVAIE
jgi:hypothetical protein